MDTLNRHLSLTRFQPPPMHSGLIHRRRVLAIYDQVPPGGTALISAPAGFGKTLSVADWIHHRGLQTVWISLEPEDHSVELFQKKGKDAIHQLFPGFRQEWKTIGKRYVRATPKEQALLLAAFFRRQSGSAVWVLDNIHCLNNSPSVQMLGELARQLPESHRLFLMGRRIPEMLYDSLIFRPPTTFVTLESLRFDEQEIRSLLNRYQIDLSRCQRFLLTDQTAGWPMGVMMTLRSLQTDRKEGLVEALRGHYRPLTGFLADEFFHQWPAHIQSFLLETSVLERLSAPLCRWVTGREDSAQILKELAKETPFLMINERWQEEYTYQKLMATFLRHRLYRSNMDRARELHRKAAIYFEQEKKYVEAIDHWIRAGELDRAASTMTGQLPNLLKTPQGLARWQRWMRRFPEEVLERHPLVRFTEARRMLWREDVQGAKELAAAGLGGTDSEALQKLSGIQRQEYWIVQGNLAVLERDFLQAKRCFLKAGQEVADDDEYCPGWPVLHVPPGILETEDGLLRSAPGFFGDLTLAGEGTDWVFAPWAHSDRDPQGLLGVLEAEMTYQRNQLAKIGGLLMPAMVKAEQAKCWQVYGAAVRLLAQLLLAQGKSGEATDVLARAQKQAHSEGLAELARFLEVHEALTTLRTGQLAEAAEWIRRSGPAISLPSEEKSRLVPLVKARILLYIREYEMAEMILFQQETSARHENRQLEWAEILLLLAMVYEQQGNLKQALEMLDESLNVSQRQHYVRLYVDEGLPVLSLLSDYRRWGEKKLEVRRERREFARKLEAELRKQAKKRSFEEVVPTMPKGPHRFLVEPLTVRERQVLHALAEGRTVAELAERLRIKPSTAKVHIRNLYGKLNVSSRTEAVRVARETGLLAPQKLLSEK